VPRYGRDPDGLTPRLYRMGDMVAGPFYRGQPGACVETTFDPPAAWRAEDPIDPTAFAAGAEYP
jgi:hypothetical protein